MSSAPAGSSNFVRILIGLVLGASVGVVVNVWAGDDAERKRGVDGVITYVADPLGQLFLRLLFVTIVPLVFASLALAVARLGDLRQLGRMGGKTMAFFLLTTTLAVLIGLALVNTIRPGVGLTEADQAKLREKSSADDKKKITQETKFGVDTLVNIVPKNFLEAAARPYPDMLAIICVALLTGVGLTRMEPAKAQPVIALLEAVNELTSFVIGLALAFAPIGVCALIFKTTAKLGVDVLYLLGWYVLTVIIALAIQMFGSFSVLIATLGGMNPATFFRKAWAPIVTAFSTSSSSGTLPTSLRCAEEELGVPPTVARFVLPLSASMFHNGTALFEGITVMFLAQVFGANLSTEQQVQVVLLSVLTATGMAGVPGGSIPLMGMVLATVGVEPGLIALVLGVDRILDMCRTTVNVVGDLAAAVVVGRSEARYLSTDPTEQQHHAASTSTDAAG